MATSNGSHLSEFTLSANTADASEWREWCPCTIIAPGRSHGVGAAFQVDHRRILLTACATADAPFCGPNPEAVLDAMVISGTFRIFYSTAAVPEPTSMLLPMAAGLVGMAASRRKAC